MQSAQKMDYVGEIDKEGKACGIGMQMIAKTEEIKFYGTFLNDQKHGIGKRKGYILTNSVLLGIYYTATRSVMSHWYKDQKGHAEITDKEVVDNVKTALDSLIQDQT